MQCMGVGASLVLNTSSLLVSGFVLSPIGASVLWQSSCTLDACTWWQNTSLW